ncbi:MAG: hypothetical protein ACE5G0_16410 [Rhodothermales bacterium]
MPRPRHFGYLCNRPCPPCPTEPWVILAGVIVARNKVQAIDRYTHRRHVISFAETYHRCAGRYGLAVHPTFAALMPTREANIIIDLAASEEPEAEPAARATFRQPDNSLSALPIFFTVAEEGESFADLLEREGDRTFYDPRTQETYTLREFYALADINPRETVSSIEEAIAPLEGVRLRVSDLRLVRAGLEETLDRRGLEQLETLYSGSPGAVAELPAIALRGLGPRSKLGQKLADKTIADVAAMTRTNFVEMAVKSAPRREKTALKKQAQEVWTRASRVARIGKAWGSPT